MYSLEQFVSPELLEELLSFSSIVSVMSGIPGMLISLATYIAISLSLYTIADRRDIKYAWLAWIPVVQVWVLGAIADDYRMKAAGQRKKRRTVLLVTNIAVCILSIVIVVGTVIMLVVRVSGTLVCGSANPELIDAIVGVLAWAGVCMLVPMAVAIVHAVFYYIALYDVYRSCEPGNATLYLVLSIILNVTQPIFLFLCRNKDDGMPKPQIPPVSWQPQEPPAEP